MQVLRLHPVYFLLAIVICLLTGHVFSQTKNQKGFNSAEKFISEKVSTGEVADLKKAFGDNQQIRAKFLEVLLTDGYKDLKIHRHGLTIYNATIVGPLDLINADIPFDVEFTYCVFKDKVDFSKSKFRKDLSMIDCQFEDQAVFSRMEVEKGAYFWGEDPSVVKKSLKEGKPKRTIFKKDAKFDRINVGGSINMETTTFEGAADFASMKIQGNAYFGGERGKVQFFSSVSFSDAFVGGLMDFGSEDEGAKFIKDQEPAKDKEAGKKEIDFKGLKVGSHLALRSAEISRPAYFTGATIGGDFKAQKAHFIDKVSFERMKVGREMNLTGASFDGLLNFSGADIRGNLNASKAAILNEGKADFQNLKATRGVNFQGAKLQGSLDFQHAAIGGPLLFDWSTKEESAASSQPAMKMDKPPTLAEKQTFLLKEANFEEVIIRGPIKDESHRLKKEHTALKNLQNLENAKAGGIIDLEKTVVGGRLLLEGIAIQEFNGPELQVKGLANFDRVKFENKVNLQKSNFQCLELNQVVWPTSKAGINICRMVFQDLNSLGIKDVLDLLNKSSFDKKCYQQLEDYLERINQKELADEVFRNERQNDIEANYTPTAWYDSWKTPFKWFLNLSGWLTGYGRSNSRILGITLGIILFGALWFNPNYLQDGRTFPNMTNRKLLRLLLSLDIFLPNLPQKLTDLTRFPRIELGLESSWQAPKNLRTLNAYMWIHKTAGYLLFFMLFPVAYQFIKKFLEG